MAKKEKRYFNLLKPILPPKSVWDKIYDWVLNYARVIILFVEILMVGAFFLKVVVDNIEKNKRQEFEQLELQMLSRAEPNEEEFRRLQEKSVQYKFLWQGSNTYSQVLSEIYTNIPNPDNQFSLRIAGNQLTITGYDDLESLRNLENFLKQSETFEDAYIDDLSLGQSDIRLDSGRFALTAIINEDLLRRNPI